MQPGPPPGDDQGQGQRQPLQPEQMKAFGQMAVQVNNGITQVGQVLQRIDPDAAEKMSQVQQVFQQTVQAAVSGGARQPAGDMRSPEAGAANVQPAQG